LAREGCRLALAARGADALVAVAQELESEAVVHAVDLREPDAPAALVQATIEAFGGIDIVVANAGATKRGDFLELSDADWADGFALKFFAHVLLIRAAWPHLAARCGSVVSISGVGGRTPGAEFAIGGSVNAAILSLAKALAAKGRADGVQVNVVNPGAIRTERLNVRIRALAESHGIVEAEQRLLDDLGIARFGEPADIAALVAFVVSARGRFLHGALIDMDGGQTRTI
jgi:3-oxoacyl-[acyl-carrier protein] reductase